MAAGDFTMTSIAPVVYSAAQTVSAEPAKSLDAVTLDFDDKGVAVGDTVYVPYTGVNSVAAFTPAATAPFGAAATASSIAITIGASSKDSWTVSGEQEQSLINGGNEAEWFRLKSENAMRALRNAAAAACTLAIKKGASRATGTAGTTPFASDLTAITAAKKILLDNGAPDLDLQLVCNTDAYTNLLNLPIINQAYLAGSAEERRRGIVLNQYGATVRVDNSIVTHTKGTATGLDVTSAGAAVGDTTLPMEGSSSGTVLAGDIVTFSGGTSDTNKYVVADATQTVSGAASGNMIINRNGVRVVKVDADECTIGANYTGSYLLEKSAVVGIMRPPKIPVGGQIVATMPITDKFGLTYLMVKIVNYGAITYEIHLAYGFKAVQCEHIATILG
jgi:hypothetical protein